MSKILFSDWDNYKRTDIPIEDEVETLPEQIDRITINHDRGRCTVYINDKLIFSAMNAGSDYQLTLER